MFKYHTICLKLYGQCFYSNVSSQPISYLPSRFSMIETLQDLYFGFNASVMFGNCIDNQT